MAVWLLSSPGCDREGHPTLACNQGPAIHPVGYQELIFIDSTRERTLKTAIWYPTVKGTRNAVGAFPGGALDPAGGPYPLILWSHGNLGRSTDGQNNFLTNAWASRGLIVVAPDHQKNTGYDQDASYAAIMPFLRAGDIRLVIDQMLLLNADPKSFLHGMIDPEAIGMAGASFGGHTTLLISGARFNLDYQADWCQRHPDGWEGCLRLDEIQSLKPGQLVFNETDPRVKAALAMAPDGFEAFHADGMAPIKIPIMLMGGERDTLVRPEEQQRPMYAAIRSTKYLLIQKNADHFVYANGCNSWDWDSLPLCSTLHEPILSASLAFWMLHLKRDPAGGDLLRMCVARLPEVALASAEASPSSLDH
jgi:predicted dienelactone hydrolase